MNYLSPTPRTYEFRYATSYRAHDGLEWVIVAKSMKDLERAWRATAPVHCLFNPHETNEVRIKRP
jgi:hypothetical protein